jgi:hypothetical protein
LPVLIDPLVVDPRLPDRDRPDARLDLPLVLVAVANHLAMPDHVSLVSVSLDVVGYLRLNGLGQHPLSALPQNRRQRVMRHVNEDRLHWKRNVVCRTLNHGVSSVNG